MYYSDRFESVGVCASHQSRVYVLYDSSKYRHIYLNVRSRIHTQLYTCFACAFYLFKE